MLRWTIGSVGLLGAAVALALVMTRGEPLRIPYDSPSAVAEGRGIYVEHCAACHGRNLEGQPDWRVRDAAGYLPAPPHDETGHTWHHPDAQLFEITKLGTEAIVGGTYRSAMIGFGDMLSDAEILAALAYIKSRWPERIIAQHNRINAEAAR